MDQIRTGKFIAELRKEHHLTQQQLGDRIGVTNKTVSRWENGNYMPDIDMLLILSQEFQVSVNELLSGKKLNDAEFRKNADENILAVSRQNVFSFAERKRFWISKWRKDHIALFVVMGIMDMIYLVCCFAFMEPVLIGLTGIIFVAEYGWQNNQMMIYVENHLYGNNNQGTV